MDTKRWFQSKGVWGGIAAVIAGLLKGRNIEIGDLLPSLINNFDAVLAFVGGIVAIVGRVRASKVIAPKPDTSTIAGGPRLPLIILGALCVLGVSSAKAKGATNLETRKPGSGSSASWILGFLIIFSLFLGGCSTTQVAQSPAGAAVITKVSNSVIDKGLNAGAARIDTGNPYLHSLADGLRSVEGQVLTADDVKKIAANFGDPANKTKFKTLALDVWSVVHDAALKIGWTAATELAAQTLQSAAVNPTPPSP